jgi:aldehyde:ferredoxin oxidoreductase
MKILRVNMNKLEGCFENLPDEWRLVGGRGLIAKIMNREVPPLADPLGIENKLIIAGGPLAGTLAPQLGRISVGGKSPLTLGIKEANAGGVAAQNLDRLGIRAIIVEGMPPTDKLFGLKITKEGFGFIPMDEYKGMKNYALVEKLRNQHGKRISSISIGIAGERKYKSASVSFSDMLGDPSRNAARGGLGAVMASKGLKAIVIDSSGAPSVEIADKEKFKETVASWIDTLNKDVTCWLYRQFGTPLAVSTNSYQGTMPWQNYTSGRPSGFQQVSGEAIKKLNLERGGKMHACMPGCIIQCSILYHRADGTPLCSAQEYEAIGLLGTNLGITDPDAIGRLKYICDDLGIDLIEIGSALGVAAEGGRMKMGDVEGAVGLLAELEKGSEFGKILGDGVVSTAKALQISRIPAFKGQAIPAHDGRAAKGIGVTYATSPMGADHTAGLTYRNPLQKTGQAANSLRFQVAASACDTFGYCLNAVPGGQASIYSFLADLLTARYGTKVMADDVLKMAKETIQEERKFNAGAGFEKIWERYPSFYRTEPLPPTQSVFDVEDAEIEGIWTQLDSFREPKQIWEMRFDPMPPLLFGIGAVRQLGERAKQLKMKKALIIADPIMGKLGNTDEIRGVLEKSGIASIVFSDVEPDPPVEEIEKIAKIYRAESCDGLIALGGGSSMDAGKGAAIKVSQPGPLTEYEAAMGGAGKIKSPLPPLICIPTTSGTGSEANSYAIITDKERAKKFLIISKWIIPSLALIDPNITRTMPKSLTAETGVDALAHCIEGYVSKITPFHPYYSGLAIAGVKLIGNSLRQAYNNGDDLKARMDMCMAAIDGGMAFAKGLGLGHAIGHALGAQYHLSHGKALAVSLLCFVRVNKEVCKNEFLDLALALGRTEDLESALTQLYRDLNLPVRFRDLGITEEGLKTIAFEVSKDAANLAGNPVPVSDRRILELLQEFY